MYLTAEGIFLWARTTQQGRHTPLLNHSVAHCWDYGPPKLVSSSWTFSGFLLLCCTHVRQWKVSFHEQCLFSEVSASRGEIVKLVANSLLRVWVFLALCSYQRVWEHKYLFPQVLWGAPALCSTCARPYGTDTVTPSQGCMHEGLWVDGDAAPPLGGQGRTVSLRCRVLGHLEEWTLQRSQVWHVTDSGLWKTDGRGQPV